MARPPRPPRALGCESEREHVLNVPSPPLAAGSSTRAVAFRAEVVQPSLLGCNGFSSRYLRDSERTMYRLGVAANPRTCCEASAPRNQLLNILPTTKPELVGHRGERDVVLNGHHVRLLGPTRWSSASTSTDLCSRHLQPLTWSAGMVDRARQNAALAATLIEQTCLKQGSASSPRSSPCTPSRGAPMTSKCTAQLDRRPRGDSLADLAPTSAMTTPSPRPSSRP